MSNHIAVDLFNRASHNPSFFSVRNSSAHQGDLLDFCVPVNLHFPPAELTEMIRADLSEILRYYPDYSETHQQNLAAMNGLDPEMIVPGNGSTEIITLLCQRAAGPIVTSVPTFSRWTDLPEELQVPLSTLLRRPEHNFRLDVNEIVGRVRDVGARTLVVSNPNNPTGAWLTLEEIKVLVAELADLDAVIIDESFIDFSDLDSAAALVSQAPNLFVVKSMGKSLGWHGVRLGYAVAQPAAAAALRERLPLWNINGLAAYVLKTLMHFQAEYRGSFPKVAADRAYMAARLSSIPDLTVYPSKANFIYVELPERISGRALRNRLLMDHGLMVRECSNKIGAGERYLRVAVHRRPAVDKLVAALSHELSVAPASQARFIAGA